MIVFDSCSSAIARLHASITVQTRCKRVQVRYADTECLQRWAQTNDWEPAELELF